MKSPWPTKKLGECIEEKKVKNKENKKLPVYSVSNIHGFILSEEFFDKQVYSKNLMNYKLVQKGDFAYNPARINVGSIGLFKKDEPGLVSPMYIVFRVSRSDYLFPKFLFYLLKTQRYVEKIKRIAMSRGSVRRVLVFNDLRDFEISLPLLPIQQKIVYILDSIQEAIGAQEKIIEKTKELKRAMMADLFKYGAPSFKKGRKLKKTEIGEIPEDWEVVRLGETCDLYQPKTISGDEILEEGPYKVYGANGVIGYYTKYNHEESEVLITCRGSTCGSINVSEPKCWITGNAMVVHPKMKNLNKKFLYYLLSNSNLFETISGSGQPQITRASLYPYKIFLPSLPEQQEIAEILQTIDQKIELEQRKKALYEELFRAMLNKLMSAEIRVKDIEFN